MPRHFLTLCQFLVNKKRPFCLACFRALFPPDEGSIVTILGISQLSGELLSKQIAKSVHRLVMAGEISNWQPTEAIQ